MYSYVLQLVHAFASDSWGQHAVQWASGRFDGTPPVTGVGLEFGLAINRQTAVDMLCAVPHHHHMLSSEVTYASRVDNPAPRQYILVWASGGVLEKTPCRAQHTNVAK